MPRPLPHEREGAVLVPGSDHDYNVYQLIETEVVYDSRYGMYFEYGGQRLDEGEVLVKAKVAC